VFEFFDGLGLSPDFLREVNQHQVARLAAGFDALGLDEAVVSRDRHARVEHLGGFLALGAPQAGRISERLHARGVWTDYRGESLRLGPAPYLSDAQLDEAIDALREVVGALRA
jgi:kynureninase